MSRIADTDSVPNQRKDWIIDVSQVIREPAQWPECCIYRVPKKLRNVNKDAYTPKLISIGPLHHRRKELRDMEKLKMRYFKQYCDRVLKGDEGGASTADQEKEVQLQKRLTSIVAENSEKIRHCYAECPPLEFVRIIVVDATFIIELFLRAFGDTEDHGNDYILSKPWLRYGIKQDLILLENQLPFFILEKIHKQFSMPFTREKTDFLTLADGYFSDAFDFDDKKKSGLREVKHFTHLLRCLYCLAKRKDKSSLKPNAALKEKGVESKRVAGKSPDREHFKQGLEPSASLAVSCMQGFEPSAEPAVHLKQCFEPLAKPAQCVKAAFEPSAEQVVQSFEPPANLAGGESVDYQNSESKKEAGMIWKNIMSSASKLEEAGVEFRMVGSELFKIAFKKGKCLEWIPCLNCSWLLACLPCLNCFPCSDSVQPLLELPQFVVEDLTETVFRNLMALEQCYYPREANYICDYIKVLDDLIDTKKDVDLLVSKKIIKNHLGSNNAVATMINKLCKEIVYTDFRYDHLYEQLNMHCDNFWNHAMATLKSAYFDNIWKGTATVVGLIVLGFTLWDFLRPYVSHES